MNNPKISVALASSRASLEVWSNCSRLFPQWMHTVSRLLQHRAVFFRWFCSKKSCSQCISSFKENAQWGKTETHKVQKGNTVNCYWNSTSKLLAVWFWFVFKKDHLRTPVMNRALGFSHWHLPLCHPKITPVLVALLSLKKPDESWPVPVSWVLEFSGSPSLTSSHPQPACSPGEPFYQDDEVSGTSVSWRDTVGAGSVQSRGDWAGISSMHINIW